MNSGSFNSVPHQVFIRSQSLNHPTDIPRFVRELRERTGLTQEKFAARLGVTFPTINRWENGRAKPSPLAMQKIEELLRKMGDRGSDLLNEIMGQDIF
jgi:putative transcriptional regulator